MADKQPKRPREEDDNTLFDIETEDLKRYKSYNQILSILEGDEEDEPPISQELSSDILTSLQNEISFSALDSITNSKKSDLEPVLDNTNNNNTLLASSVLKEEDEKEKVIKHLLEASDDELGIPNKVDQLFENDFINGGDYDFSSLGDGFWEFEDETANYYTLMQSQLFM